MTRAHLVAVLALGCGCGSTSRSVTQGPVWAQPGADVVISWSLHETTEEGWTQATGEAKEYHWFVTTRSTSVDGATPTVIDPVTGASLRLARSDGAVTAFYWDAHGKVLWAEDGSHGLQGLTPEGRVDTGKSHLVHVPGIPAPFAVDTARSALLDLATGRRLELPPEALAGVVAVDGAVLRFTRLTDQLGAVVATQTVIDTSGPALRRLADVSFATPRLLATVGTRDQTGIVPDGRRFVEVVTTAQGTRMIAYDLQRAQRIADIPIAIAPELGKALHDHALTVNPLAAGLVMFTTPVTRVYEGCLRGVVVDLDHERSAAIPESVCVTGFDGDPGRRWLTRNKARFYVDPELRGLELPGGRTRPIGVGPTTIVFAHLSAGGERLEIEKLDLATGERTQLATHATTVDELFNVSRDRLIFKTPAGAFIAQSLGDGGTRP